MTAAVLQFNQHKPLKPSKQTHTPKHTQHQSASNNQSDYIDTPMTKEYHQIMIDLLNTEHPFRAVRLAEEFNYENGFELIPVGIIRKWKKEIMKKENVEIKSQNPQNDFLENDFLKNEFCQNEIVNIKKWKYEKAFKDLLEN